jgi:hypothetical protein
MIHPVTQRAIPEIISKPCGLNPVFEREIAEELEIGYSTSIFLKIAFIEESTLKSITVVGFL